MGSDFKIGELRIGRPTNPASEGCRAAALAEADLPMKYVYILQSEQEPEHFYTGITDNLKARLSKHNAGEVTHTAKYRP